MGAVRYGLILTDIDIRKAELFGTGYISQHFLKWQEEHSYRLYLTDALKLLTENTAKPGKMLKFGYGEMFAARYAPKEEQSAQQVVNGIKARLKMI